MWRSLWFATLAELGSPSFEVLNCVVLQMIRHLSTFVIPTFELDVVSPSMRSCLPVRTICRTRLDRAEDPQAACLVSQQCLICKEGRVKH